ncbi:MAG: ribosome-recycling factor, partial [Carnobacterium jeotgali]
QDDLRTFEEDIQKITNESVKNIDAIAAEKEKELLDV